MNNFPLSAAGRIETLGITSSDGVDVTSGTANNYGTLTSIGTSTFDYDGFDLVMTAGAATRFQITVTATTQASDQIVVQDFYLDLSINGTLATVVMPFPIRVQSGATLKVKTKAVTANSHARFAIIGKQRADWAAPRGFRKLIPLTDYTNTDPSNSVTQGGAGVTSAWTNFGAAGPSVACAGAIFTLSGMGDATRTNSRIGVDIGKGASPAAVLFSFLGQQQTNNVIPGIYGPYFFDIPASLQLSWRQTAIAAAADSFSVAAHGLVL